MENSFPGIPCPPLDSIFMICRQMQNWLDIDPKNVLVVHCQQSRGRSTLILSCFLSFFHLKDFDGPKDSFRNVCKVGKIDPQSVLLPS